MADDAQAFATREVERDAKIDRGVSQFVATHAERDDTQRLQLRRPASNFHRRLGTELASGIQDERSAQAAERHGLRDFADGRDIRFQILHAAEHDARGDSHFGVDDILAQQFFAELTGDERVIFGVRKNDVTHLKVSRNPLKFEYCSGDWLRRA